MKFLQSSKGKTMLGLGVCTLAFLMIYIGVADNEVGVVFKKAINICMECIGIG